jgi:hypothetical protein
VILAVHGKLDAVTSPLFDQRVMPMLERGDCKFLIDLAHLDYISSAALRRLLLLAKDGRRGRGEGGPGLPEGAHPGDLRLGGFYLDLPDLCLPGGGDPIILTRRVIGCPIQGGEFMAQKPSNLPLRCR